MVWRNIGMMEKELERNNEIMQPWTGRGNFSRPFEGRLKPPLPDVVRIFQYSGSKTND
jgi:hypothetical protein